MWFLQSGLTIQNILIQILAILAVIFAVLPFHEFLRAYIAHKLGDNTAKHCGQMTLNPLVHFDPFGALSLLIFNFGWAKPVFIDPGNFKRPRRDLILTTVCGPISYIIAAIFGGIFLNVITLICYPITTAYFSLIYNFLSAYILICVRLAIFNLVPIPPFDGFKILELLIPTKYIIKFRKYHNIIIIVMFVLLLFGFFDKPLGILQSVVYFSVIKITQFPFMIFK
ncbi:MAG: site-2 protease family protein [Oscillospiraceae bacterium]|nr:site-2 protease family protein [Oscillospiraceae bacterium]